ncbi:MAG: hypothetical protein R3C20_03835 [Planctomycetaceae bacterium]
MPGTNQRNEYREFQDSSNICGPPVLITLVNHPGIQADEASPLIQSIFGEVVVFSNRDGEWHHLVSPSSLRMLPGKWREPLALMTLQGIGGSDYFGTVHWSMSRNFGRTWSQPEPISAFAREVVAGRGKTVSQQVFAMSCRVSSGVDADPRGWSCGFLQKGITSPEGAASKVSRLRDPIIGWNLVFPAYS